MTLWHCLLCVCVQADEKAELSSRAKGDVVLGLLPLVDNFELARTQVKAETEAEQKINNSYQVGGGGRGVGPVWLTTAGAGGGGRGAVWARCGGGQWSPHRPACLPGWERSMCSCGGQLYKEGLHSARGTTACCRPRKGARLTGSTPACLLPATGPVQADG